jgi:hypothetical protein
MIINFINTHKSQIVAAACIFGGEVVLQIYLSGF